MKNGNEQTLSIVNLDELSKLFVLADDNQQASLLNSIAKYWHRNITTKGDSNMEMQLCWIVEKLTPEAIKLFSDMVEFIKLKDKE